MITAAALWWALFRWRWIRNVGAEVAAQAARACPADEKENSAALMLQMERIQRVARWVPRSRCLDRAVTLVRWAHRHQIAAELCIGVRHIDGRVHAHAWVQSGAQLIDPNPEIVQTFQRLHAAMLPEHFTR